MQLLNAFTFLTLAVSSVYGSAIDTSVLDNNALEVRSLEERATCVAADVQHIKDRINHFNVFCQMYNAQYRRDSPLPGLTNTKMIAACSCILSSWNGRANPTSAPPASDTCSNAAISLVTKEAPKNYKSYCSWWTSMYRNRSAIPGVSADQITKGCQCMVAANAQPQPASTSTSTTQPPPAATSVAACKKRRRVRRNVNAVPAVAPATTPVPMR